MTEAERRAAAAARAQQMRAPSDRPRERRCAEVVGAGERPRVRARLQSMELRTADDGSTVSFSGVASAYEAPYEMWDCFGPYTEIMSAGSGAQSLAQPDLDVPLVLQHDSLRRIARTTNGSLQLSETEIGLQVDAPTLDLSDVDVAYIVPKMRAQLIDEMSFMFRITSGQWSPDYMEYRINTYDIQRGDVAIVGYGANPATTAELRSVDLVSLGVDELRIQERAIAEELQRRGARSSMTFDEVLRIDTRVR